VEFEQMSEIGFYLMCHTLVCGRRLIICGRPLTLAIMAATEVEAESAAVTRFRDYLHINTMQPEPDYGSDGLAINWRLDLSCRP